MRYMLPMPRKVCLMQNFQLIAEQLPNFFTHLSTVLRCWMEFLLLGCWMLHFCWIVLWLLLNLCYKICSSFSRFTCHAYENIWIFTCILIWNRFKNCIKSRWLSSDLRNGNWLWGKSFEYVCLKGVNPHQLFRKKSSLSLMLVKLG